MLSFLFGSVLVLNRYFFAVYLFIWKCLKHTIIVILFTSFFDWCSKKANPNYQRDNKELANFEFEYKSDDHIRYNLRDLQLRILKYTLKIIITNVTNFWHLWFHPVVCWYWSIVRRGCTRMVFIYDLGGISHVQMWFISVLNNHFNCTNIGYALTLPLVNL